MKLRFVFNLVSAGVETARRTGGRALRKNEGTEHHGESCPAIIERCPVL